MLKKYDAIVIGAGNGGMVAADALTQQGLKVLLLERHNVPGGCGTSFRRGRFEFEVALHQLSGMGSSEHPGPLRGLLMRLGVADQIEWLEMDQLYRVVIPGQLDITLPADRAGAIAELQRQFPAQAEPISAFYDLVYLYMLHTLQFSQARKRGESNPTDYPLYFKYGLKTANEVMDEFFADPLLRLVLSETYCGFMGMPPSKLPFNLLAGLIFAYIEFKPYHMKGGSQSLSNALVNDIIARGSDVRFNCGVEKILVENNRVCGVRTAEGEDIACDWIVSNISPIDTYTRLLEDVPIPEEQFDILSGSQVGVSAICLYTGLDCPPESLGIDQSMLILPAVGGADKTFDESTRSFDMDKSSVILGCYTIDHPSFSPPGTSQCVILTLQYAEHWEALAPEAYNEMKYRCADQLLQRVEAIYPGFREHIEEIDVATPITFMRFLNHPGGAFYGFDQNVKDSNTFISPVSPLEGLYFAGTWVGECGFQPTLESGFTAAQAIKRQREKEAQV